ncbi:MAG: hypothetical protein HQ574_01830, partial [Chloroflexi bacterium]|nr:hypothetical protein [Chloroflexota bacterium]
MDLTIVGLAISYQIYPSLQSLKEFLFTGIPAKGGEILDPVEVAIQAVTDVTPPQQAEIGIISPDGFNTALLESNLTGVVDRVIDIGSFSGSLMESLQEADRWIQERITRLVLIIQFTNSGTSCIVLADPNSSYTAYAKLNPVSEIENVLSRSGLISINQDLQSLSQSLNGKLAKLPKLVPGKSQIAISGNPFQSIQASGLINLIFTTLAVSEKIIPQAGYSFEGDPFPTIKGFYIPTHPTPWLSQGIDYQRSALFMAASTNILLEESFVIQESPHSKPQSLFRRISPLDPYLFLIGGENQEELLNNLEVFGRDLEKSTLLSDLSYDAYAQVIERNYPFICSIVGADRESLTKETNHAITGVENAFTDLRAWNSPGGSYFTPTPLRESGLAFVYPGAFNSYQDMARDLFTSFPILHELVKDIVPNLSHSMAEEFLYPRSSDSVELINDFYNHPNQLVESGITLSVLHTLVLSHIFQIKPDSAFGYSLGEASMLWSNQIWQNTQNSSAAWQNSSLFKSDLTGNMNAVRSFWKDQQLEEDFWSSFILKTSPELAKAACDKEPYVYLTIINTPGEVVIAGEKNACRRVVEDLSCHALPMPFNAAIHNPAMQSCYESLKNIYTNETLPVSEIKFYSAADYQSLSLLSEPLAHAMAKMTC